MTEAYREKTTAELKELHAEGTIDRETLEREIAILNDPDDPLGGGYGLALPVKGKSFFATFLSRKQLLDHDVEWAVIETRKQLRQYGVDDEQVAAPIIDRTVEVWRKLNGVERQQAS